ncbi:aspartyl aminopeptidase [Phtheirospermum japonicum]|uniref:aspartyl aminopeptidase n=1 Tax=Phtheirospermum japonicum TaxID=374723 RepID=A0A830CFK2_9LAMI|nr:aspartyl aminopeptidase [Phtheirospermum japonicum]
MAAIPRFLHLHSSPLPKPSAIPSKFPRFSPFFTVRTNNDGNYRLNGGGRRLSTAPPLRSNSESNSSSAESSQSIVGDLLDYLNESWTQFHATGIVASHFVVSETMHWYSVGSGFHVIAAHTDSPCLKLKPKSALSKSGYLMVNVQTYGGGLWHTWFDRDLSLAGRVIVRADDGSFSHKLVKIKRPLLRVPTLAIHLDRTVNTDGFKPNLETHLIPLLAVQANKTSSESDEKASTSSSKDAHHQLLMQILSDELGCKVQDIASLELNVCDTQPSCLGGANDEFIFSGRLDNLASSFCAFRALVDACASPENLADEHAIRMVALFDNEEQEFYLCCVDLGMGVIHGCIPRSPTLHFLKIRIYGNGYKGFNSKIRWKKGVSSAGACPKYSMSLYTRAIVLKRHAREVGSDSYQGAGAPTMFEAMRRIIANLGHQSVGECGFARTIRHSFLVSADMAHGVHPNFADKHEENHRPVLQKGLVIKHNANQRYATSGVTSFLFKEVAKTHNLPIQEFVVRNDMGCGSTIGPILASGVGIRTVDCGIPQLSMHSVREVCGKEDVDIAYRHFKAFYKTFSSIDKRLNVDF